jgi:peptidoglycan/LPS O-acetylase OafA/YrhL
MKSARQPAIVALTSLRGLLALWVVVFHFWNDLTTLFPLLLPLSPLATRGDFAVPGFFILSGFVLSRNHGGEFERLERGPILRFLALRVARIYPVHFATLIAVLVMVVVARKLGFQLDDAGYSLRLFGLNLFLVQSWLPGIELSWNFPSWSISSEWFAYLLFPVFAWLGLRSLTSPARTSLTFMALGAVDVAVYLGWTSWPFRMLAIVIPAFLAGMCGDRLTSGVQVNEGQRRAWAEVCAIAIVLACFVQRQAALATQLIALQALVVCLAAGQLLARRLWEAKPLVYLGTISYSLYMTHTLAAKVINQVLPPSLFSGAPWPTRALVVLAYAVSVSLIAVLSYYLVERPMREWGRHKLRRVEAPSTKSGSRRLKLAGEGQP